MPIAFNFEFTADGAGTSVDKEARALLSAWMDDPTLAISVLGDIVARAPTEREAVAHLANLVAASLKTASLLAHGVAASTGIDANTIVRRALTRLETDAPSSGRRT